MPAPETCDQHGRRQQIDHFRLDVGSGSVVAVILGLLAVLLVPVSVSRGARQGSVWLVTLDTFLLLLIAAVLLAVGRRPVLLAVGPDGLQLPLALRSPVPWERIDTIRRLPNTGLLPLRGEWLRVDLDPGYLPDYRIPTLRLRRLEVWLLRRAGLRIGLHMLEADAAAIIASIERYLPVAE